MRVKKQPSITRAFTVARSAARCLEVVLRMTLATKEQRVTNNCAIRRAPNLQTSRRAPSNRKCALR